MIILIAKAAAVQVGILLEILKKRINYKAMSVNNQVTISSLIESMARLVPLPDFNLNH